MGENKTVKVPGRRPDIATVAGLLVGLGGIMCGLILDGGKVRDIVQFNAALIVFGGTLGAVMVTTPLQTLLGATRRLSTLFFSETHSTEAVINEIIEYAM